MVIKVIKKGFVKREIKRTLVKIGIDPLLTKRMKNRYFEQDFEKKKGNKETFEELKIHLKKLIKKKEFGEELIKTLDALEKVAILDQETIELLEGLIKDHSFNKEVYGKVHKLIYHLTKEPTNKIFEKQIFEHFDKEIAKNIVQNW